MKRINEDHKEIASGKKKDDEGYMARIELDSIERSIKNLRKVIKNSDTQLPAWVQSKITRAADYIDSATEYLQSDQDLDEQLTRAEYEKNKQRRKREAQIANSIPTHTINSPTIKPIQQNTVSVPAIDPQQHTQQTKITTKNRKARNLAARTKNPNEASVARGKSGIQYNKPQLEENSLVDQILSEMGCGCDKKKKKKNLQYEEKDPKGPVQSYKTPEEIAKKHGVSLESIKAQLKMGIKVEKEHTSDETDARITALQHLDEVPNYYTKLKKVESQQESKIVRDMFGNISYEFIDLIGADPLIKEAKKSKKNNPCWDGYKKDPNKADFEKDSCIKIDEAIMPQKNGHNMSVTLMWRAKYYNIQMFFPQIKIPNRREITDEANKVYPGCKVVTYAPCAVQSNVPIIQVPDKKSKNYLMNNGTIGEEVEILEAKKSQMKCNKPKAEPHGSGETGKSHVVKACEGGEEKLIRFGQKGVKGSPKKKNESEAYANRRSRFKKRHEKNIKKGKMSAAYWANKVKWE